MEAIENVLRPNSILRLSESNFLPNDFNVETENLLDDAPFSSTDFKNELVIVFAHAWKLLSSEFTDACKGRAQRLDDIPVVGRFARTTCLCFGSMSANELHRVLLQRDFVAFQCQFNKVIKKHTNPATTYDKNINTHMNQQVEKKCLFNGSTSLTICRTMFGSTLEKFKKVERKDRKKTAVASFHMLS